MLSGIKKGRRESGNGFVHCAILWVRHETELYQTPCGVQGKINCALIQLLAGAGLHREGELRSAFPFTYTVFSVTSKLYTNQRTLPLLFRPTPRFGYARGFLHNNKNSTQNLITPVDHIRALSEHAW